MKPQLLGFHHIAIIASNYARSKHFYMEILGAKQLNETYRAEREIDGREVTGLDCD